MFCITRSIAILSIISRWTNAIVSSLAIFALMGGLAVVCSLSTLVDIWKYVHSFRTASKSVRWWCVLLNRTFLNIHHRSYDMLWYIYYFVRWPGCFIHFYSKRQKQLACLSLVGGWQPSTQHNNKIKIFKFLKKKKKQQQQQRSQVVTILTTSTPAQDNIAIGGMWGGGGGGINESYRKKQKVVECAKTFATYCILKILNSSNKDGVNIKICKFVNLAYI